MKRSDVIDLLQKGSLAHRAAAIEPLLLDSIRVRAARSLPRMGVLYFFYDAEHLPSALVQSDWGGWQVLYCPDPRRITATSPEPAELEGPIDACGVRFDEETTLPGWESDEILALDLTDAEDDAYTRLGKKVNPDLLAEPPAVHRLLGHPDLRQADMREECQYAFHGIFTYLREARTDPRAAELGKGIMDWMLLFQIDEDDELGTTWGDCGRVYFRIRRQDLARTDFSKALALLQCY